MTIVRKEKPMSAVQAQRLKLDKTVQNLELGKGRKATFTEGRKALQKATDNDNEGKVFKSPALAWKDAAARAATAASSSGTRQNTPKPAKS